MSLPSEARAGRAGRLIKLAVLRTPPEKLLNDLGEARRIWGLEWHPVDDELATCGNRSIQIWGPTAALRDSNESFEDVTDDCQRPAPPNSWLDWQLKATFGEGIHSRTIRNLAFTAAGDRLAAASFDSTASIWHRQPLTKSSGAVCNRQYRWVCVGIVEGHENEVKSVSWSPCAGFLATCSRDKTAWIHERIKISAQNQANSSPPALAAAPSAATATSPSSELNSEKCLNTEEYYCASILTGHGQDVKSVRWHPALDAVATASYDETVKIWTRGPQDDEWLLQATLAAHEGTVWSLSFSPDGNQLASVSEDKKLCIYTCQRRPPRHSPPPAGELPPDAGSAGGGAGLSPASFHNAALVIVDPLMRRAALADADDLLRQQKEFQQDYVDNCEWHCSTTLKEVADLAAYSVDWAPSQDLLAIGSGDNSIRVFSPAMVSTDGDNSATLLAFRKSPSAAAPPTDWTEAACRFHAHGADVNVVRWRRITDDVRPGGSFLLASGGDDTFVNLWLYRPH